MAGRLSTWWSKSSRSRRFLVIGGSLVSLLVIGIVGLVVFLLQPADSIEDYSQYYRDDVQPLVDGEVSINFFGVSTLFLVDAFFTRPPKADALTEMESDPAVVAEFIENYDMDDVEAVLVAHSHFDHAIDVPAVAEMTGATIWGTESTLNIGRGGDVPESQLRLAFTGQSIKIGDFSVRFEESPHSMVPGIEPELQIPTIDEPLIQPATSAAFAEGGNWNFVVTHGDEVYVVVASAGYREGGLAGVDADVLLLGTALLGMQEPSFQQEYLEETIGITNPELIIPLHWDDFVSSWAEGDAKFNPRLIDAEPARGFDLLIEASEEIDAEFVVLQAGSRIVTD